MSLYTITLEYEGKQYSFLDTYNYEGWDEHCDADYQVTHMYTEGNYACDCNRSDFLYQHCDVDFKGNPKTELDEHYEDGGAWTLPCGDTIKIVSIKEGKRALKIDEDDEPPVYQVAASGLWLPS